MIKEKVGDRIPTRQVFVLRGLEQEAAPLGIDLVGVSGSVGREEVREGPQVSGEKNVQEFLLVQARQR